MYGLIGFSEETFEILADRVSRFSAEGQELSYLLCREAKDREGGWWLSIALLNR
jgi:hypothetical protein